MSGLVVSDDQRRARIGTRHALASSNKLTRLDEVANALVALHSSDPVSVYLSAAARLREPTVEVIDHALYDEPKVIRHHAMRRTLWVMTEPTARLAHTAATIKIAKTERTKLVKQLAEHPDVSDPDVWIDEAAAEIISVLESMGTATTRQLTARLPHLKLPIDLDPRRPGTNMASVMSRLLLVMGFEAKVVRSRPGGSWINSQYEWAPPSALLVDGPLSSTLPDPRRAAAQLAEQWLHAFGPAPATDLRWWMGWTVKMTKEALADIEAVEVELDDGSQGWIGADDTDPVATPEPWVALLPGLDPTTMGWKSRDWYLSTVAAAEVFDRNGNGGPTVWANGRVIGAWAQRADGRIVHELFNPVDRPTRGAIDEAIGQLVEFLGDIRFRVRFPPPAQPRLLTLADDLSGA